MPRGGVPLRQPHTEAHSPARRKPLHARQTESGETGGARLACRAVERCARAPTVRTDGVGPRSSPRYPVAHSRAEGWLGPCQRVLQLPRWTRWRARHTSLGRCVYTPSRGVRPAHVAYVRCALRSPVFAEGLGETGDQRLWHRIVHALQGLHAGASAEASPAAPHRELVARGRPHAAKG